MTKERMQNEVVRLQQERVEIEAQTGLTREAIRSQIIEKEMFLLRRERREIEGLIDAVKAETRALGRLIGAIRKAKRVVRHIKPEAHSE